MKLKQLPLAKHLVQHLAVHLEKHLVQHLTVQLLKNLASHQGLLPGEVERDGEL